MSIVTHVIVAVAGRGKRLGQGLPKCLVEVDSHPILAYQMYLLRDVLNVRLVTGYFEDQVVEYARRLRQDILFVRNPNFRHTKTLQSLSMAARALHGNCLCLDGDMIIEEDSFSKFLADCADGKPRIAISSEITKDPVYAYVEDGAEGLEVTGFGRENIGHYEWANMAYVPAEWLTFEDTDFFERLDKFTPLAASIVKRVEIDTPEDLAFAESFLRKTPNYCGRIIA